ncbi:MAG TPA: amino acid permease [Terriglobales bacterium]|jgi:APA family basic amino acid/polyamine antiporter
MTNLVRTLSFRDMVLLIVGSVIGSGIFLVPGVVLRQVDGSVGVAILVWVGGGVLSLLGALTYGEMAAMKPEAGGLYVYIRDAFGPMPAFLYGWAMFLAISSGTIASLAVAFSTYLNAVLPLGPVTSKLISVLTIVLVTAVNVWGTRKSSDFQNWTTLIKVLMILSMCAVLLFLGRGYSATASAIPAGTVNVALLSKFGLGMIGVLWAYEGWQFITYSAGEVKNPQKDFPRSLLWSVLALAAVYLIANAGYLVALGPAHAAASDTIAATAFTAVLGPSAGKLIALTILISVFSAVNTVPLTAPRVFYAMASDGLFFRKLADVHPGFHTPATAIIALGIWSAVLSCFGQFQQLISYTIFVAWIFYGLGAASIFVYRTKYADLPRPYRVPGYPWTPLIFTLAAAALVVNVVVSTPVNGMAGLGIVAIGVPVYFLWRNRSGGTLAQRVDVRSISPE